MKRKDTKEGEGKRRGEPGKKSAWKILYRGGLHQVDMNTKSGEIYKT